MAEEGNISPADLGFADLVGFGVESQILQQGRDFLRRRGVLR